ncbi:MAG: lipid-A-disaccharide synthase [Pseudomonadota bacterium]|nr:lipid-A-disaccharide synthase [Pseudomonadota bacterium]
MTQAVFVAGEQSGDLLGASLIEALRVRRPSLVCSGVAGPQMVTAGCRAERSSDELAVMGLTEVLAHLPRLLALRRTLVRRYRAQPPDVFVGIDAPDFNLGLERRLRRAGIPTVHYVSPSVWAWRQRRVKTVAAAADRLLCLFPFELDFYRAHGVDARFVGHPLADRLPLRVDSLAARRRLGLAADGPLLAVLPGSRHGEVARLGPLFAQTLAQLAAARPALRYVAPMASPAIDAQFAAALAAHAPQVPVQRVAGESTAAMAAADAVLLASGTATLEAMLLKRPMIVAYQLAPLTWQIVRRMVKVPHVALPNLLAGEALVPEYLQADATPLALAAAVLGMLDDTARRERLQARFTELHEQLRRDAAAQAAEVVLELLPG